MYVHPQPYVQRPIILGAFNRKSYPDDSDSPGTDGQARSLLKGRRVLIVEDEFFLAMLIEDALESFGCETLGPFTTLEFGLQASRREDFDIAILDINLNGKMVFPLADELMARGIPFVFLTGYASKDIPEAYRKLKRVQKPFDPNVIKETLEEALSEFN